MTISPTFVGRPGVLREALCAHVLCGDDCVCAHVNFLSCRPEHVFVLELCGRGIEQYVMQVRFVGSLSV